MLEAGKETLLRGSAHLTSSLGDQGAFLSQQEGSMRWFLLASDLTSLPADGPATTSLFQPRTYPNPTPHTQLSEQRGVCGEGEEEEEEEGACPPHSDPAVCGDGPNGASKEEKEGVCFHSPPKAIFKPTVEVENKFTLGC